MKYGETIWMWRRGGGCLLFLALLVFFLAKPPLGAETIDFESLGDLESVTTQFPALTFSNTIALTAGISLNEFEFPPASGSVVVSDDFGPIVIEFGVPVTSFGGLFTYLVPLTLEAHDATDTLVASASSAFTSNLALSGDSGSSPNELLAVAFSGGISRLTITGDPFGGSLTLDDATYTAVTAVPEPSGSALLLLGLIWVAFRRKTINR